jgi:hypothetical protein
MRADRKTKGFFSIDRGAFRCTAIGGLNSAIAYLVMARGTGADNRTTQWSVNAIEKYTGISRPNARKAVADLLERGIWKKTREGNHPIYEAVPGNQIPGGPFTAAEKAVIAAIRNGKAVPDDAVAEALKARGIVRSANHQRYRSVDLDDAAIAALSEPLAIWLPNAVVDGAAGEVPPIELIRQTRNLPALRLLVELYEIQFLPIFGGIPREMLQRKFGRLHVGETGPFVVWGFSEEMLHGSYKLAQPFLTGKIKTRDDGTRYDEGWDTTFWPAVHVLESLGLIEPVGMLLDGNDPEAEIIHPYGIKGGDPAERKLAQAAHEAAVAMVTERQLWRADKRAEMEGHYNLVPVRKHIVDATLVEIFRLRYRPHTKATGAWYAQMKESTAEWLARYEAMIRDRGERQSAA